MLSAESRSTFGSVSLERGSWLDLTGVSAEHAVDSRFCDVFTVSKPDRADNNGNRIEEDPMDDHQSPPAVKIVDPHADRLLRDLLAIGLLEADNRPSADERLTTKLGEDLLQALRAEQGRLDAGALPIRSCPQSAA
jgi:hypothetical protein